MWKRMHRRLRPEQRSGRITGHTRWIAWMVGGVLVMVFGASAFTFAHAAGLGAPPPAADRFVQSITTGDGALGWQQLCPSARAQVGRDMLIQQADAERASAAQQGITFSWDFVGARPQPAGGELRLYVITARSSSGAVVQRTYSVLTQASGCVADVKNQ